MRTVIILLKNDKLIDIYDNQELAEKNAEELANDICYEANLKGIFSDYKVKK